MDLSHIYAYNLLSLTLPLSHFHFATLDFLLFQRFIQIPVLVTLHLFFSLPGKRSSGIFKYFFPSHFFCLVSVCSNITTLEGLLLIPLYKIKHIYKKNTFLA